MRKTEPKSTSVVVQSGVCGVVNRDFPDPFPCTLKKGHGGFHCGDNGRGFSDHYPGESTDVWRHRRGLPL